MSSWSSCINLVLGYLQLYWLMRWALPFLCIGCCLFEGAHFFLFSFPMYTKKKKLKPQFLLFIIYFMFWILNLLINKYIKVRIFKIDYVYNWFLLLCVVGVGIYMCDVRVKFSFQISAATLQPCPWEEPWTRGNGPKIWGNKDRDSSFWNS